MAVNIDKTKLIIFHLKGKELTTMFHLLMMMMTMNPGKIYHDSSIPLNASIQIIPTQNAEVTKSLEYS
jgi:hypothetical protein